MPEDRKFYVVDFSTSHGAEDFRRRQARDRAESRRRYRDHLAAAFARLGFPETAALADTALDALTDWRHQTDGEPCRCGCHPRLPDTELHDFGFDCPCARTPEQRRQAFEDFRESQRQFWASREGRRIVAAEEAEEDALEVWLREQPGVVVTEHGGLCPEQWSGTVDGRSFYFRERHGEWRIELDLRPSGRFANMLDGLNPDGSLRLAPRETEEGDVIATGTVEAPGYGSTPVERARFLVSTIRNHIARAQCRLHAGGLGGVEALLGVPLRWCPACGSELG